ncbi:AAA family ATPase [Sulfuriroseicoccus oceanibius]|uniref:MoxR family ATPase n=1 Tax=Sulfuriroseicoccus oceanibius TaxID=2707525 RepID=A0A6B3L517_9BACT|nr:MoxR family ATPase [Sulfuriroseicoccus oceanibius]QQL43912.1 MoxR family ATPase [Sulfuriroseicoccus oceanibius]
MSTSASPTQRPAISLDQAATTLERLSDNLNSVLVGQHEPVRKIVAAFATRGHVLLEDYPGTGKTTLAKALARSIKDATYQRVQFTPDLLPSDVLGTTVFNPKSNEFQFHRGPIFTNLLLADEINRASPRTQSSLLEAMAESQATIDGTRHPLADSFFVIATQNPVEFRGTYPLPEAQMDRFAILTRLGYVPIEDEINILNLNHNGNPANAVAPCISLGDLEDVHYFLTHHIHVSEAIKRYAVTIVAETRKQPDVQLAASPRASLAVIRLASALALLDHRDYVVPEDIKDIAVDAIAHRLVLDPAATFSGTTGTSVIDRILDSVAAPQ